MITYLLIVDPQNSFCHPDGELFVKNADKDMERLADFININSDSITKISVTLDSHNRIHIAHPAWWVDEKGNHPEPFTQISFKDIETGKWLSANPEYARWSIDYLKKTDHHIIWPYHCLTGTWGHEVYKPLDNALQTWADKYLALDYTMKGGCKFTEHFSAIKPLVEVPGDPATLPNLPLVDKLAEADKILVAGEASSHCVAETIRDMISHNGSLCEKLVLLTDAMSPVPGFEDEGEFFLSEMKSYKVEKSTTKTFFNNNTPFA